MPDGGGLRLTVAEYLTPSLHHVTNVGSAQYDKSRKYIGGGIFPDVDCESKGIPSNPSADLCVDKALDVLNQVNDIKYQRPVRLVTAGVVKVRLCVVSAKERTFDLLLVTHSCYFAILFVRNYRMTFDFQSDRSRAE